MLQSSNETTERDARTAGLTASERYRLLSSGRRRLALEVLSGRSDPVDLADLAAAVAALDDGLDGDDERAVERVGVTLHHAHLPRMDDLGVLDYDPDACRIHP